jgi:glycosyltransferase involved in cell wall biosynthesis
MPTGVSTTRTRNRDLPSATSARAASSKIRILELNGRNTGGNAEYLLQLCRGLDRDRFEITAAFPPGGKQDDDVRAAATDWVEIHFHHDGGVWSTLRGFVQLVRLMRQRDFDVVHTHTSLAAALGRIAAWWTGVPTTIHMLHSVASHDRVPPVRRWLFRQAERFFDRFTTAYVAPSQAMIDEGLRGKIFSADKVRLVYNGIDCDAIEQAPPLDLRAELRLAPQTRIIGYLGRLVKQKGLPDLIAAVAQLRTKHSDFCVAIVGDGPMSDEIQQQINRAGLQDHFHFLGWRSDVGSVLREFDLLAMPSLWEAFGLAAVEAMAACKPVVATQVQGLQEVVEHDVTGLLVPPGAPDCLAAALGRLLDSPALRQQMGEQGRLRARRLFDVQRVVREHESLFVELCRPKISERAEERSIPKSRAA